MVYRTEKMINDKVDIAVERLLRRDAFLFAKDVNERSISHRLACYLQDLFDDWEVDCEYNRDHDDPKLLKRLRISSERVDPDDIQARTVFPDIIVHHRGTNNNLLVIEIKKTTNPLADDFDIEKLKEFKCQLHYSYALFLRFKARRAKTGVAKKQWI